MCAVKVTVIVGMFLALAIGATARAQGSVVDTQLEVTTALVQSSLTIQAIKKADDAKFSELQARIDALGAQVKTGRAKQADLTVANEALVASLSETDAGYKAEIQAFRGAVTNIASTPEGLAALARYNAGDQVGALAILDRLQAADEAARQKLTNVEKAVGERRIAALALDARDKSKVTTDSVILRYEAVVKLDRAEILDWRVLDRLYLAAGRTADARKAALASADPLNEDVQGDLMVGLSRTGVARKARGDLSGAARDYEEELAISRRRAATHPTSAGRQSDLSTALEDLGDVLSAQSNPRGALDAYHESLTIRRRLAETIDDLDLERGSARDLDKSGAVLISQKGLDEAKRDIAEALLISRRLAVASPTDARVQGEIGIAETELAETTNSGTAWSGAAAQWNKMDKSGILFVGDRHYLDEARANAAKTAAN
jgi:tetratricopeptide (TPR) repeat protein